MESGGALPCTFGCMVDPSPSSDDDVFALTKSATAQAAAASSISAPSCVTPDSISLVASAGFPLRQRDYPHPIINRVTLRTKDAVPTAYSALVVTCVRMQQGKS